MVDLEAEDSEDGEADGYEAEDDENGLSPGLAPSRSRKTHPKVGNRSCVPKPSAGKWPLMIKRMTRSRMVLRLLWHQLLEECRLVQVRPVPPGDAHASSKARQLFQMDMDDEVV